MAKAEKPLKVSIATSAVLVLFKFCAGWVTQSMAIFASALDSLLDVGNSLVNLLASKEAAKPPDKEHEYGHGKIESLAALFQSEIILASGFYLVSESVKRLFTGQKIHGAGWGILVMLLSLTITFFLVRYLRGECRKEESKILEVEELHFSMDLWSGLGVVAALLIVQFTGHGYWDLVISLAVAAWIFKSAFGIMRSAVNELLDRSIGPVTHEEITALIQSYHPKITGLHDFRSRRVAGRIFLDFHIEIKDETDFIKAHDIAESLVSQLKERYKEADVTIHYDPPGAP